MGQKILVLLPIAGQPLQARYHGPYAIERKLNDVDYIVSTPDRRKERQLCHINMLKEYHTKEYNHAENIPVQVAALTVSNRTSNQTENNAETDFPQEVGIRLDNSQMLANLESKLSHLQNAERTELEQLIQSNLQLFPDTPSQTDLIYHDVDVGNAEPVKQHPY